MTVFSVNSDRFLADPVCQFLSIKNLKLLLQAVKRKTGKGGGMNFFNLIGRRIENFALGHGGGLKFPQKVLKVFQALPGSYL